MRQFLGDRRPKAQRPRAPSSRHNASGSVSLHYVCLGPAVWRYLYVYIYIYMYVCISVCMYVYIYIYMDICTCIKHIHTKVYMHIHVYAVWTYIHTRHILICPPTCLSVYMSSTYELFNFMWLFTFVIILCISICSRPPHSPSSASSSSRSFTPWPSASRSV